MVEERQHEQNDRVLSSRANFGDRDRSHILGMGASEPPGVYRTSIQSRRGSRTQATGACERTRFGTGGDTELTFACTGTSRSARGDGLTEPTGACERTRFGTGGGDTELTFACAIGIRQEQNPDPIPPRKANSDDDWGHRRVKTKAAYHLCERAALESVLGQKPLSLLFCRLA
jgi:hypothetical protein